MCEPTGGRTPAYTAFTQNAFYVGANQPALLSIADLLISVTQAGSPPNTQVVIEGHPLDSGSIPMAIATILGAPP